MGTHNSHICKQYTREEMLQCVKEWYSIHGKIVNRDLKHDNNMPTHYQIKNEFGSFPNCLKEAGIPQHNTKLFNREYLSDDELLNRYKRFVSEYLKTHLFLPTNDEVDRCDYIPTCGTFIRRFGNFEHINELIGYEKDFNKNQLEKDMLFKYKKACEDFGHTLDSREITNLSKENKNAIYCTESYTEHFGSIHNLQELCGVTKTNPGRGIDRNDLIERLQYLAQELGRIPVQKDLILYDYMPCVSKYIDEFGSFKAALQESGFKETRIFKTKNGVKVRSTYELRVAQLLESYNINYLTEVPYKKVIPNFNRGYRFDFCFIYNNKNYYIELFGIQNNESYEKRKQEKIKLCNDNNINLIQLYQSDIYAKTNLEIYNYIFSFVKSEAA